MSGTFPPRRGVAARRASVAALPGGPPPLPPSETSPLTSYVPDPEPRRSVRSTKGQHKAHEAPEAASGPKKRGRKGGKKSEEKQEESEVEVIRCVCGATEQDEDDGAAWIACDQCGAWQHNVCMGVSEFAEDIPKHYFCEVCKPEDHKELLDGVARGEKPWEDRRRAAEEEKARDKKKKGGRKAKGKRGSDPKEEALAKAKASPAPEPKKEAKAAAGAKRKSRAASEEKDGKVGTPLPRTRARPRLTRRQGAQKMRKVSETQAVPVPPAYEPPADLPAKVAELPDSRQPPARALFKSLVVAIGVAEKKHGFAPADGLSVEARAEGLALQIERAVLDTHPNHKEYGSQIKTLAFNLKANPDLCNRLLAGSLTPPALAVMSTDELASKELQRETAEMRARAEKQSILVTEDGPRVRRTHKGEEMVEGDSFTVPSEDRPSALRRQSVREPEPKAQQDAERPAPPDSPARAARRRSPPEEALRVETRHSPKTDFDINKVFSSVRSPAAAHHRRPSQPVPSSAGPGVDPEVDRLLQDDREESPPYSPTEETDPDVVWRGDITMASVAAFQATARHMGGANLTTTLGVPWRALVPKRLLVSGRIDEQKATEYLCGLRYSPNTDVSVVGLSPATEAAREQYYALARYFIEKKRYGVIGDKGVANVRDTYLIAVPPGTGNHPEFMLNLEDNFVPPVRSEPLLLVVFIYRNEPAVLEKLHGAGWGGQQTSPVAPGSAPAAAAPRAPSLSAPAFSPMTPQGAFPTYAPAARTPDQLPGYGASRHPAPAPAAGGPSSRRAASPSAAQGQQTQQEGEALARHILGPLADCTTVGFILPQAQHMTAQEWLLIKDICEREPRARNDLQHLSLMIENASKAHNAQQQQAPPPPPKTSQTPVPIPQVPHSVVPAPRPSQVHQAHGVQPAAAPPT